MTSAPKDVYLHVGLPKTGTTTLQSAFDLAREAMLAEGLLFPAGHHQQRRAVYDLLGRRIRGDDEPVAGSFPRLIEEIRAYTGPAVLVSEELLGLSGPRAARRLARALPDDRLHVVLGVRDLARTVSAAWQQEVLRGGTITWRDFVRAVRAPESGARAGVAFWLRHDPLRVLDAWETVVPRERVHLVTVPAAGSPATHLLARFSRVLGLPEGTLAPDAATRNRSLSSVGIEVVRRLNANLEGRLPPRQYIHVVEEGVRRGLAEVPGAPQAFAADDLTWLRARADGIVEELRRRGYAVEGDLDELRPRIEGSQTPAGDDVSEAALLHATEQALTAAALAHGRLFRRYRRATEPGRDRAAALQRVTSASRAAGFQTRVTALEVADRSRLLGWAARQYLRLTSRQG